MNKNDYITKIYNMRKGLNDPKFKSDTHKFYYAKGILKQRYPDDIDIIESIKPSDIVISNDSNNKKNFRITYHEETYIPKPIYKPSIDYFTFDLDTVEHNKSLMDVNKDDIDRLGVIPYIRWYSVIHGVSQSDKVISKFLYDHAPIRTLKKDVVYDEVKSSIMRYFSYLNYNESYDIQYNWEPDESYLNNSIIKAVYHDLVVAYKKLELRFKDCDLKLDYVKDMMRDHYHHEIYSIRNDVVTKKQCKVKYLAMDHISIKDFWDYYQPIENQQIAKDMWKMNQKPKRWW